MFVHHDGWIDNLDTISTIDCRDLISKRRIYLHKKNGIIDMVDGPEAFSLVMKVCPAFLEGKRAKYLRHAWAIHNLIGHPLMQICSWLRLPALVLKIHDATIPNPITK